jgi:hypothetical protein
MCGLLVLSGCSKKSPSATATGQTVLTPSAAPSQAPSPTPAPYPSDYHGAVLAAWVNHDSTSLNLLVSNVGPFNAIAGTPNTNWTKLECSGAAGTTGCVYYNNDGDEIIIGVDNEKYGNHEYHAGRLLVWDPMKYPTNAKSYVDKFLKAWISGNVAREKLLATANVVAHYATLTKIDFSYVVDDTGGGAAGSTYVHITHSGGFDQTVRLNNELLGGGKPHAIANCSPIC